MSEKTSQVITQILSMVVGTTIIAVFLFGAYKEGKKEFQKTLKDFKPKA
ncbi:MAG: hypothetical protein IJR36_04585 [Lachnospiraceae bacterium]|nr:hypothetical protein [Lachnospiraceae bacterium]MBQ9561958.1 hypothetical protein [Lachnospiraceae bacterium]MBQ9593134.1 hypothetical protein [Lachnospiraceae bacterium]MBR0153619.1 hypothetical protein [Lachnospiraceae bacterium]